MSPQPEASAGHYLDLDRWHRREHFRLFRGYDRPHFSVTAELDVTALYAASRLPDGPSFFLGTLFATLHAANAVEAFRLRLRGDRVWRHDVLGIGSTVPRPDRTFGFGTYPYETSLDEFVARGRAELDRVRASVDLLDEGAQDDAQVHTTVLPWIRFTGYTNALARDDSVPKICFGQRFAVADAWRMPVAVEVHHALVDGIDVGEFLEHLQENLARFDPRPGAAGHTARAREEPASRPPVVTPVTLPPLGEGVSRATLSRWLKPPGARILRGDALVELETDHFFVEVAAPVAGTLQVVREEGALVSVGEELARIVSE